MNSTRLKKGVTPFPHQKFRLCQHHQDRFHAAPIDIGRIFNSSPADRHINQSAHFDYFSRFKIFNQPNITPRGVVVAGTGLACLGKKCNGAVGRDELGQPTTVVDRRHFLERVELGRVSALSDLAKVAAGGVKLRLRGQRRVKLSRSTVAEVVAAP